MMFCVKYNCIFNIFNVDTYEEKTIKMISLDNITVYTMYVQRFLSHSRHFESLYHSDPSKEIKSFHIFYLREYFAQCSYIYTYVKLWFLLHRTYRT